MVEEGVEGSGRESGKGDGEVMETPNKSKTGQIAASVAKFEDSPVFNFLNSLSPIKPVKSMHISQTINPLNFASLPSVFTSPHATSPRDSRILRRHQLSDPSKREFVPDEGSGDQERPEKIDGTKHSDVQEESHKVRGREPDGELAGEASFDCSQFVVDYSEDPSYNGSGRKSCPVHEAVSNGDGASTSSKLISCLPGSSQSVPPCRNQVDMGGENLIVQNGEVPSWDSLISNALMFESPTDTDSYKKSMDPGSSFYASIQNDMQSIQALLSAGSGEQLPEDNELTSQPGEGRELPEGYESIAGSSEIDPVEEMDIDYEHLFGLYRGMRRRCLVFEMGGSRRKHLEETSASDSSAMLQSESNDFSRDQSPVPMKAENRSGRHVLPGIGLHLNALATTPKDYRIVSHDSSASGRLVIGPSSSVSFPPSTDNEVLENGIIPAEDQAVVYMANEDINQSSPKKRRKAEQSGDSEGCKRCNCKKSKCLKLYCECFAAGVYCVELCACVDCFNKPVHEDTVLATRKQIESRNPLAFAPKVIRGSDPLSETGDDSSKTPASARHKRGCNCKKSGCLKKYCECYQGGVGCSINCRCEGCKNAFGRKDGLEADIEEDDTFASAKVALERPSSQDMAFENELDPATPRRTRRPLNQHQLSTKKKPPRASSVSSSLPSNVHVQNVLGKQPLLETVKEDEMPDFLQEPSPPSCVVKSSSPNGKRVSPPHSGAGLRSSRKLILQSIPSFPSLSQNQ